MRVPLTWLRQYVELPLETQKVADLLANLGFPVNGIEKRPQISGVVVGRIVELEKHPNADRLQVGKIDVGAGHPLTIATAATNVAPGQVIAVATIGAQLPHLKIERRKMRGLESEGMMISADELALPPEWFEDGILQLDQQTPLGVDAVEYFGLGADVLDVDVTSNRVDAMSVIGLARELAASLRQPLRLPDFTNPGSGDDAGGAPRVSIESPDCIRFVAQRFDGVRVGTAPAWMRIRLALAGQRPINTIVDISNYVMLETGQPLHFYDEARVAGGHLIVRDAKPGEKLVTLDGAEQTLQPGALVIADERGALGLAGLKGGKSSEVSDSTTSVLLESATFNGPRIRRMSTTLLLRTDAGTRHEKSLAPILGDYGAARAAQLMAQAGARAYAPRAFGAPLEPSKPIDFPLDDVRRLLGFDLTVEEVREALDALGFALGDQHDRRLTVTPPPWRRDITIAADVLEEIARMAGYDRLRAEIPAIADHAIVSRDYLLERKIARTLASLGYHEIISYALHGAGVFEKLARAGVEPSSAPVEIRNPLSEDQRYLRYALGPGMLDYAARLDRPLRIFEIGRVFYLEDAQPMETPTLAFALATEPIDEPPWRDTTFLRIKGECEELVHALTGRRDFDTVPDVRNGLHPGKTAVLLVDGREIANIGRIDPRVCKAFGVRLPMYVANIYLENIPDYATPLYAAPSKFPSTYRDLALLCDVDVHAASIERCIRTALGALCTSARVFDEYRGPQVPQGRKSLAARITLQLADATITDAQADAAVAKTLDALRDELGVALRA